ncbi:MAG: hypothetical protein GXO55_10860 [Chloroflexi bacterium]|nr:hypothetical protein [Chloroflexota bacterium]
MATELETVRIDKEEWLEFANQFTKDNEGRPVTVEIVDPELGDQEEAEAVPFVALTYDAKHTGEFIITIGREPDLVDHQVDKPKEVWVEKGPDGRVMALAIISETGTQHIIHFHD